MFSMGVFHLPFRWQVFVAESVAESAPYPHGTWQVGWVGLVPMGAHGVTLALSLSHLGIAQLAHRLLAISLD